MLSRLEIEETLHVKVKREESLPEDENQIEELRRKKEAVSKRETRMLESDRRREL